MGQGRRFTRTAVGDRDPLDLSKTAGKSHSSPAGLGRSRKRANTGQKGPEKWEQGREIQTEYAIKGFFLLDRVDTHMVCMTSLLPCLHPAVQIILCSATSTERARPSSLLTR
jgi:hypothetical protein